MVPASTCVPDGAGGDGWGLGGAGHGSIAVLVVVIRGLTPNNFIAAPILICTDSSNPNTVERNVIMATPATKLLPSSADAWVAGLTNGSYWVLDSNRIIKWGFSDFRNEGWTPSVAGPVVAGVLSKFSEVANISFQYVGNFTKPSESVADITFLRTSYAPYLGFGNATAIGIFPHAAISNEIANYMTGAQGAYTNAAGDVWLNLLSPDINSSYSYAPGSKFNFVLLHEIGHALGLKHPHDSGGTGRPTFSQLGLSGFDDQLLTIMSYDETTTIAQWFSSYGLPSSIGYPSTLMPMDVIALQHLYGPNNSTRSGNDTYQLTNDLQIETFWDAGGFDILDASSSGYGWLISLNALQHGNHNIALGIPLDWSGNSETGKFYFNAEGIKGSSQSDILIGNDLNNIINGNSGDDIIYGADGDDFLIGGHGNDIISGGLGSDIVYGDVELNRLPAVVYCTTTQAIYPYL